MNISGPLLKNKAEELARKLDHFDFKATDGWLLRWKCKHLIHFKKAHGEKSSADFASVEEWKSTILPELLCKLTSDNI